MSAANLQKVDYPYATKAFDGDNNRHVIYYNEFRAQFGPNDDFGHPGDVWINIFPPTYGLYTRSKDKWMKWPGTTRQITPRILHPHLPVFLCCTETGISWIHHSETRNVGETIDQSPNGARDIIGKFLAREAKAEAGEQDKRKLVAERSSNQNHTSVTSRQVEPEQAVSDGPLFTSRFTYKKLINIDD